MTTNDSNNGITSSTFNVTVEHRKFCPVCGQELGKGWKYCSQCGNEIGFLEAKSPWIIPYFPIYPNYPQYPKYPEPIQPIITWGTQTIAPVPTTTTGCADLH